MGIPIGKLSLYVAGAGIHPGQTLPVCLDVGTDNEPLREDPLYLGTPRPRASGPEYDGLVEAFVTAALKRWPRALVQFEDFGIRNAFRLLDVYRDRVRCFNDDIQGTGAVALAGVLAGLRAVDGGAGPAGRGAGSGDLAGQRVVIAGAGSAGIGIARALEGAQTWVLDSKGLLTADRRDSLLEFQRPWARAEAPGTLVEIAKRVRPTVLIGVAGRPGLFSREVIEAMDGPRPLVFPLSNPTSQSECTPEQARAWTGGRALVATGSPFPDTAQCNNMYIFPGIGLGAACSGASRITNRMFAAAARVLVAMTPEGALYPRLSEVRKISAAIALEVGKEAFAAGLAEPIADDALRARIAETMWEPRYLPYRAGPNALTRAQALRHGV
jgi:malate dehydrogenase (oxaloacetate-decarboxylating)(NADP+)